MPNGPSVSGMVNDPDYASLAPADQRAALQKLTGDKSFAELSDAETLQFNGKFKVAAQPPAAKQDYVGGILGKATGIGPAPSIMDRLRAGSVPGIDELQSGLQSAQAGTGLPKQSTLMGNIGQTVGMLMHNPATQALAGAAIPIPEAQTNPAREWQAMNEAIGATKTAVRIPKTATSIEEAATMPARGLQNEGFT